MIVADIKIAARGHAINQTQSTHEYFNTWSCYMQWNYRVYIVWDSESFYLDLVFDTQSLIPVQVQLCLI